jgi:hypothetical protein
MPPVIYLTFSFQNLFNWVCGAVNTAYFITSYVSCIVQPPNKNKMGVSNEDHYWPNVIVTGKIMSLFFFCSLPISIKIVEKLGKITGWLSTLYTIVIILIYSFKSY